MAVAVCGKGTKKIGVEKWKGKERAGTDGETKKKRVGVCCVTFYPPHPAPGSWFPGTVHAHWAAHAVQAAQERGSPAATPGA